MKKLVTLLVVLFSVLPLFAQDGYKSFLKDGRRWVVELRDNCQPCMDGQLMKGCVRGVETYTIAGDTIIDGQSMKIICHEGKGLQFNPEYFGAFEKNRQVFECDFVTGRTSLAISFNKKDWENADRTVTESEIMSGGESYRCINIDSYPTLCVEGIGLNTEHRLNNYGVAVSSTHYLSAVYDGDELIFSEEDFYAPSYIGLPGESNAITNVSDNSSVSSSAMYDLMGRRITQPRRGAIVLQNGGKRIVK